MGTVARNRFLIRALLASLALHCVLLAFIPPLAHLEGAQNVELLSFVHVAPIHIQTPRPHRERPAIAPVRGAAPRVALAHAPAAAARSIAKATSHAPAQRQHAPIAGTAEPGGVTVANGVAPVAAASSTPLAAPSAAPGRQVVGGYMPLGAEEPVPVLDPSVRKALLALGVHVTLTVTVDANGRTQNVAFAPPLDDSVERQIRSLLAAASWDPAVCGGGMSCEGQAVIRL
ncbi:MAG TPA: hypothetical protein VMA98_08345 [Candidatus Acidoferrales bacterium]|nr:hypothetical protein [Candidatus Acidoferrales bacterium]